MEEGPTERADRPIGVFDSGVGGLTVLRELRRTLPSEGFIYLGDTARVPYGTKSADSVARYAVGAAEHLVARDVKLLVVACNTASALALDALRIRFGSLPIVGVVEPGARAAVKDGSGGRHLVLATESTVANRAYSQAIVRLDPDALVTELPCSVLVSLAEEGWASGPVVDAALRTYLDPVLQAGEGAPDTVLLGCTHFPVLAHAIREVVGPAPRIVDSARTTAEAVRGALLEGELARKGGGRGPLDLLATDGAERFARVGTRFLAEPFSGERVEIVDL